MCSGVHHSCEVYPGKSAALGGPIQNSRNRRRRTACNPGGAERYINPITRYLKAVPCRAEADWQSILSIHRRVKALMMISRSTLSSRRFSRTRTRMMSDLSRSPFVNLVQGRRSSRFSHLGLSAWKPAGRASCGSGSWMATR